jgi:hypothetical protein
MTSPPTSPDLGILEVAALCGVTKARVYQRLADPNDPLPSIKRAVTPGHRMVTRVPTTAALAWRAERLAHGHAVGEAPLELLDQLLVPPAQPVLIMPSIPIGLPRFTPF